MKLKLAEKLKHLRRNKDITQEQLAVTLGVSFQAVSRWETGITYPDIELLPVIAGYFDITVDELLGTAQVKNESRFTEYLEKLGELNNTDERVKLIRRMHAELPECYASVCLFCDEAGKDPEYLDEAREMVEQALKKCTDTNDRDQLILRFSNAESEERLPEFIKKYSSFLDMRENQLLYIHYMSKKNWNECSRYRQKLLAESLERAFTFLYLPTPCNESENYAEDIRNIRAAIKYIDTLIGYDGENPISGDGEPDLWLSVRIRMGLWLSSALYSIENTEASFAVLDDIISLLERYYNLPNGTVLTYRTTLLDKINVKADNYVTNVEGFERKCRMKKTFYTPEAFGVTGYDYRNSEAQIPDAIFVYLSLKEKIISKDDAKMQACIKRIEEILFVD